VGLRARTLQGALLVLLAASAAEAGPPFLTDDPEPVPLKDWELYLFATVDSSPGETAGQLPAVELNWGAAPELQLHLILPVAFSSGRGATVAGPGDATLGFKYRFVREGPGTPQVGIFPAATLPNGSADRGLGAGAVTVQLPIWVQRSFGPWTTYGGGGYTFNHGRGGRDVPFAGWLLQRELSERLTLGGELYAMGRSADDTPATTLVNAGGIASLGCGWSLLFSLGQSVAGERNRVGYLAFYSTWGPS
jgi:hypothetical protein